MRKKGISNNLVFYDLSIIHPSNLESWYYNILIWFKSHYQIPTRMAITAPFIKSKQTMSFKGGHKKLLENSFKDVDSISLFANIPNHDIDMSDFNLGVFIRLKENRNSLIICFDNDIIPFTRPYLEELIQQQAHYFNPGYGICYQRSFEQGPLFYAFGMIEGIPNKPEYQYDRSMISKWFHEYGDPETYHVGLLRDIYPLNILSHPHLNQDIYGQSLRSWIDSSLNHGELKQLTSDIWSWWVPNEHIDQIRDDLKDTNILICV